MNAFRGQTMKEQLSREADLLRLGSKKGNKYRGFKLAVEG